MKYIMCFLLMASAFAGDKGGNGGGGICVSENKCFTLAEAGLRISLEVDAFFVSEEVEKELDLILEKLPLHHLEKVLLKQRTLGGRGTFRRILKEETVKFQHIVRGYENLLRKYNPKIDRKKFTLYAVSDSLVESQKVYQTYLLPEFFKLSARDQALVLIHEGHVRGKPSSFVESAIRFDGYVYDFLFNSKGDPINFLLAYREVGMSDLSLFLHLLDEFEMSAGRKLRLSDFCFPGTYQGAKFYRSCTVGRREALRGNKTIHPRFAELLLDVTLEEGPSDGQMLFTQGKEHWAAQVLNLSNAVCEDVPAGDLVVYKLNDVSLTLVSCSENGSPENVFWLSDAKGIAPLLH